MALVLDPNPTLFVLSKSPMYMGLETDSYVVDTGSKAVLLLATVDVTDNVAGNSFNIRWADEEVIMTIVSGTPDDSGTQLPDWQTGQSAAYYASVLVDHFKMNYLLNDTYEILSATIFGVVNIYFIARNYGVEYDPFTSTLTGTGYSITGGNVPTPIITQSNYKMLVDVFVETSHENAIYEKVGTQELDPVDNICLFDISKMVNSKLSYQLPSYNETSAQRNTQTMKRFYVRYAEKYGSPVVAKKSYETSPIEALKAGFNFLQIPNTYSQIDTFYIANKLFLTRQPRTKKVSVSQQEYLHWISPDTSTANVVMKVKVYKNDGTTVEGASGVTSVGKKQLFRFPVGFNQLVTSALPAVAFGDATKYEVWVFGDWGSGYVIASEVFTFICDKDIYRDERFFLFTNSDGGIDTLRTTGLNIRTTSIENDVLNTEIRKYAGYSTADGEYKAANLLSKSTLIQNTGFLTKAQNKWLDDFFLAEKKWEVLDGKFVPIILISKQKPFDESQSKPYSFDFEYYYAFDDIVIKSEQL